MTHGAKCFRPGQVGGQASAILFILRPGEVGRHMRVSQPMVGLAWASDTPCSGAAGLLLAGIDLTSAIGVGSGRDRVLQHVLPGHTIGPSPLQRSLSRAFPQANSELAAVPHQIAQARMQRAEFVKLAKDEPHQAARQNNLFIYDLGTRV